MGLLRSPGGGDSGIYCSSGPPGSSSSSSSLAGATVPGLLVTSEEYDDVGLLLPRVGLTGVRRRCRLEAEVASSSRTASGHRGLELLQPPGQRKGGAATAVIGVAMVITVEPGEDDERR